MERVNVYVNVNVYAYASGVWILRYATPRLGFFSVILCYISRSALPLCVLFSFVFVHSLTINKRFTLLLRLLPRAYMHTTLLYITGKLSGIQSLQQSKLSFAIEEADKPKYRQQGDVM